MMFHDFSEVSRSRKSMESWSLRELRQLVETAYGPDRVNQLSPVLQSLSNKFLIVKLHLGEASKAFEEQVSNEPNVPDLLGLLFCNGEERLKFRLSQLRYEANLVAAASAVHSVSDNLAHLAHVTFNLRRDPKEYKPRLQRLRSIVPDKALKLSISRLTGLHQYRYLQAFVNCNKHMSLVQSHYQIDTPADDMLRHGVQFKSFDNGKGFIHPKKWGDDFLRELTVIQAAQIDIGRCINDSVERELGSRTKDELFEK